MDDTNHPVDDRRHEDNSAATGDPFAAVKEGGAGFQSATGALAPALWTRNGAGTEVPVAG
jgi:hypothetical protein